MGILVDEWGNKYPYENNDMCSFMRALSAKTEKELLAPSLFTKLIIGSRILDKSGKPYRKPIKVSGGDKIRFDLRMDNADS